ncbi:MAG: 5-demethoxyubiquinol-8 5-hydroxylase UbiM [Gammaproteobacteria bacterium]|nr:5-demethoxyubiquinol-8 5-hydroxylase UbiM [Gammaproteobacteria bacterium]MCP4277222.1 5-demethoxyubiquinol-8 5-hydroxylase UbiM [Gammaproteobacteria bacterium]MCP4832844.1 5-demethoxyubiquinol-8 5-hydroxylase UbiM [Gammaproteobacteria bacterium]MCP4928943.1 5-demethoxyubiquinol-8 5-hydroxylase UbiM [Gammaproteobacteria bacterium]
MNYDIIIIGAGPAGLSFARSLKDSKLKLLVIEKAPAKAIQKPAPDGREIALTHLSEKLLKELDVWERISPESISPIKSAKVMDGNSPYSLGFDTDNKSGDALGYLVPNYRIRQALYNAVEGQDNLEFMTDISVNSLSTDNQGGVVHLSNGESRQAKLIVAADSRFSATRREMGIGASMKDFGKTAIVCRMEHQQPHEQTAFECFHYGRTLAVLPMAGKLSSIVITVDNELADDIVNMDEAEFDRDIEQRFGHRLGDMKLIGERYAYPLVAVHADHFVANRFAVIGDAAVGMHPVTAHGFNLGLRGQATLASLIKNARIHGKDIGSKKVLAPYENRHMRITKPMYWGTNGIVGLFTDDRRPAKALRSLVLRVANNFPPIKHIIKNSLTEVRR